MSIEIGTVVRAGTEHSAIILAGSILEVKRSNTKGLKNTFSSVDEWAASLGVETSSLTYTRASAKPTKLDRIFKYNVGTPHWRIAKDLLDHYNTKIHVYQIYNTASTKEQITKVQITLLKLDLNPPEFHPMWQNFPVNVEHARNYHETELRQLRSNIAREGHREASKSYFTYIINPHVFIKKGDKMIPLSYNEANQHVVVRRSGYERFEDYTGSTPEFWVLWQRKFSKLRVAF